MQLKEALDFGVACCPELKLAGCSQEIYISLQVVQNKIKEKKMLVWLRRQICSYRYCRVPIHCVVGKAHSKEMSLVLSPAATSGFLRSGSDQVREREGKSTDDNFGDRSEGGKAVLE